MGRTSEVLLLARKHNQMISYIGIEEFRLLFVRVLSSEVSTW